MNKLKLNEDEIIISRVCNLDGTSPYRSYQDRPFTWPLEIGAIVKAPHFNKEKLPKGNGLHGWFGGEGDGSFFAYFFGKYLFPGYKPHVWILAAVRKSDVVKLNGDVKFPKCRIVFVGDRKKTMSVLQKQYPTNILIGGNKRVGNDLTAIVGDMGTAYSGKNGCSIAGKLGTAKAGFYGKATVGCGGIAEVGSYGVAESGEYGQVIAGNAGTIKIKTMYKGLEMVIGKIGEKGLLPYCKYELSIYKDELGIIKANFVISKR